MQRIGLLAVAISLFGFHSGAALATVVGVLIEVPVILLAGGARGQPLARLVRAPRDHSVIFKEHS